jgi:hypothetical protein
MHDREEKREAKKKEVEAKKKSNKQKKKRKNGKQNVSRKRQQELECDENTCNVCLAQYMLTDDEELPWVMWIHIECIEQENQI